MNCDQFIKQHESRIHDLYKQKVLEHPDKGKIACYIISDGALNPEQQQMNQIIFANSVAEVAKELGVKLDA